LEPVGQGVGGGLEDRVAIHVGDVQRQPPALLLVLFARLN
jgi:hypothetical protein